MDESVKKNLPPFTYNEIILNLLTKEDLHDTLQWRNAYREWFNDTQTVEWHDHVIWYEHYQKKDNDFVFITTDNVGNKFGQAAIYNIHWLEKKGEFGRFLVNPLFAGQNFMKKTCQALIDLGRELLQLEEVYLEVKPDNAKAIHIYQLTGFVAVKTLENGNLRMEFQYK